VGDVEHFAAGAAYLQLLPAVRAGNESSKANLQRGQGDEAQNAPGDGQLLPLRPFCPDAASHASDI